MKPVIAFFGYKDSGKTMYIERLVRRLNEMGVKVGVIKHIHHGDFEVDREGKDTWRFSMAGAAAVSGVSPTQLYMNIRLGCYPDIDELIGFIAKYVDIILVEGMKFILADRSDIYKILVGEFPDRDIFPPILGRIRGVEDLERITRRIIGLIHE